MSLTIGEIMDKNPERTHKDVSAKELKLILRRMQNNDHNIRVDNCVEFNDCELELDIIQNDKRLSKQDLIQLLIMVQFTTDIIHQEDEYERHIGSDNHNNDIIESMRNRKDFDKLIIDKDFHYHYIEASKRVRHDILMKMIYELNPYQDKRFAYTYKLLGKILDKSFPKKK